MKYTVDKKLTLKNLKQELIIYPSLIAKIKKPNMELQLLAIEHDWRSIVFIKRPHKIVLEKAIEYSKGFVIRYLDNPKEEIQIRCLKLSKGSAFYYIKKPSKNIIKIALLENFNNIKYLKTQTTSHWDLMMESSKFRTGPWFDRLREFRELISQNEKKLTYTIIDYLLRQIIPNKVRLDCIDAFSNELKQLPNYKNNAKVVLEALNVHS